MKQDTFVTYDRSTGEKLAVIDLTKSKGRKPSKRRFVMVFVDVPSFTTDDRVTDFDVKMLMYVIGEMNEQNELRLMQDELANALKVTQPTVSKSLRRLREAHYINTPRMGVIQVSADVAWRSSLAENEKIVGMK